MKYVLGTGAILVAIGAAAYFYVKQMDEVTPEAESTEEPAEATPGTNI